MAWPKDNYKISLLSLWHFLEKVLLPSLKITLTFYILRLICWKNRWYVKVWWHRGSRHLLRHLPPKVKSSFVWIIACHWRRSLGVSTSTLLKVHQFSGRTAKAKAGIRRPPHSTHLPFDISLYVIGNSLSSSSTIGSDLTLLLSRSVPTLISSGGWRVAHLLLLTYWHKACSLPNIPK